MKLFGLALLVAASTAGLGCGRGEAPRTLALRMPDEGLTSIYSLMYRLESLISFTQGDDTFVGLVEVVHVSMIEENESGEDYSLDFGYVFQPRWADVELRVVETMRGNALGALAAEQRLHVSVVGVCPVVYRGGDGGERLVGTPEYVSRTWARCVYLDSGAQGGPVLVHLEGRFPVSYARVIPGARGLAAIVMGASPEDTEDVVGGMRLFLVELPGRSYDASVFSDEPERSEITAAELVSAIEREEAEVAQARDLTGEGEGLR